MNAIQTYQEIVGESWLRYCEACPEESWNTTEQVHTVDGLRKLKRQTIEQVLGDDTSPPKAIAFTRLKKPELFLPWIIVSKTGELFEHEIKKEILSSTPYYLRGLKLNFADSELGYDYFMLTTGTYNKATLSNGEKKKLKDFTEDCIDLAILFANPEFRTVCAELSEFPKKIAERYATDLHLRGERR